MSAYAARLLDSLDRLDWTDSLKETQRNWIGRSEGAEMHFKVADSDVVLDIFTTRADTVFGVTFMVLAPESAYVDMVTTPDRREAVKAYVEATKRKTERERMIDKKVSGEFTGAYAVNPLSGARCPSMSATMCWPATARAPSWPCPPTTAATMLSHATSTCP